MNKILTIIIPTYNMEKYLRRCLDSLIIDEEGMKKLEVLVINDGSKDSSLQIAHEYQDKYPDTYRVIDKENGNYGSCINRGLKEATGKYVKVLDADDWFDNGNFAKYVRVLYELTYEVDVIYTSLTLQFVCGENQRIIANNVEFKKKYKFDEFDFEEKGCRNLLVMHAITYRTEILINHHYFQDVGISYTDIEYDMIPMYYIDTIMFVDLNVYQYLLGREGQTVSPIINAKNLNQYFRVYDRLIVTYKEIFKNKSIICKNNARIVMFNLLSTIFSVALYYGPKNNDVNNKLLEIYNQSKDIDITLINELRNIKSFKILPVFYIWEKTGLFCTNTLLHIIIKTAIKIKKQIL